MVKKNANEKLSGATPNSQEEPAYRLTTKGYSEQFSAYTVAKRNFDSLKRKAIRAGKSFTIVLSKKNGKLWEEMEKAQVSDSFYDEN